MSRYHNLNLTLIAFAIFALSTVGCAEFDMKKNIPWGAGADGEFKAPMKVAAIWTDTVLNVANQPSKRGFGGRLMFYASEGGKPIKVEGTLHVYAFDESDRDTEKVKPDRKYVFTTEQFEKHYSKSALGHSYSVWIPWDDAGGPRREISLLVRFMPTNGAVVIGEASRQLLPGYAEADPAQYPDTAKAAKPGAEVSPMVGIMPGAATAMSTAMNQAAMNGAVQPVAYNAPLPATTPATTPAPANGMPKRMSTTTINMPNASGFRKPGTSAVPQAHDGAQNLHGGMPAGAAVGNAFNSSAAAASHSATGPAAGSSGTAASSEAAATGQSSAHFGPQRLRPLGEPLARLTRDRAPWQPTR